MAPWRDRSPVVLLTGSAGGGKSRLAAEKLHGYCLKYPGAFALIVRKVRASMTKGTVLFLKETVIGADPQVTHFESKDYFRYRNGSVLAYMGLEDQAQRERLKSIGPRGGVDIVWGEEANELLEADHNALLGRMRGAAAPWRQILYTCNPDAPTHWIYQRLIVGGEARVYTSQAGDNPHNPADYLASLGRLTGIDALRLREGQWVQATGLVYGDVWRDDAVTEDAEYIPDGGPVEWFVDDGYVGQRTAAGHWTPDSHPRVFLLAQRRPTGQIAVFAESYAAGVLSDRHIEQVLALSYPHPALAVVDKSAAELKRRLHEAQVYTQNGAPKVAESIKELRAALAADAHGARRVLVHPRCRDLRAELLSYRYAPGTDEPVKAFDHGPDALRYGVWAHRYEA